MENTMLLPPITPEGRRVFHAVWLEWMTAVASTDEMDQVLQIHEQVAGNQICSMLSLVRACYAKPQELPQLPQSLRALLQAHRWLQIAACDATASISAQPA
jgi:hypothetical protein